MRLLQGSLAVLLSAMMVCSLSVAASAALTAEAPSATSPNKTSAETPAKSTATVGVFKGTSPLAQFLYAKFTSSPATISVPISKFSSKTPEKMFAELDDAAIEAAIQNGLAEHVVKLDYSYSSSSSAVTLKVTYNNSKADTRKSHAAAVVKKAAEIRAATITAGMSDIEKATALYNYVASNVVYDFYALNDFLAQPAGKNVYTRQTPYSALIEGKAICQGFARTYKLLCDAEGIPCVVIFGQTGGNNQVAHSWNRVYLDGAWRTVDTTNSQLQICAQQGIVIDNATSKAALIPNKETLVDSYASKYL